MKDRNRREIHMQKGNWNVLQESKDITLLHGGEVKFVLIIELFNRKRRDVAADLLVVVWLLIFSLFRHDYGIR